MELEVVVGTYDSSVIGYSIDLLSDKPVLRKKFYELGHVGCVRCVASGGQYLASGGTDETIKLYNMRKHTEIGSLLHHQGSITSLTFHKSSHLLSCSEDGSVCIWKCGGSWDCLHTLTGHKHPVSSVAVHPSGVLAISVGKDRTVRTWNLLTGRAAFTLRLRTAADLVQWNPIGSHYALAIGSQLVVYDLEAGDPSIRVDVGKVINSMIFVKEDVVAVGSDQPTILLYCTTSGKKVATLEGHTSRVKGLALSPDQKLFFSASSDGSIKVWALSETLESTSCICSVASGSRLTCITTLLQSHQPFPETISSKETLKEVQENKEEISAISEDEEREVYSSDPEEEEEEEGEQDESEEEVLKKDKIKKKKGGEKTGSKLLKKRKNVRAIPNVSPPCKRKKAKVSFKAATRSKLRRNKLS